MILLKYVAKLVRLLNSETSSSALAAAFVLGMFLGLVPLLSLQGILVILVLLFLRVNITATLLTMVIFKGVKLALAGPLDGFGVSLLENEGLAGLWTFLYNNPVLSFAGTHNALTLGGTILGLVLLVPVFLIMRVIVDKYRERFNEWLIGLSIVSLVRSSKIWKLYQRLTSPFEA